MYPDSLAGRCVSRICSYFLGTQVHYNPKNPDLLPPGASSWVVAPLSTDPYLLEIDWAPDIIYTQTEVLSAHRISYTDVMNPSLGFWGLGSGEDGNQSLAAASFACTLRVCPWQSTWCHDPRDEFPTWTLDMFRVEDRRVLR